MSTANCGSDSRLERLFPNLASTGYQVTSCRADEPNCIGWALNDGHCWDPLGLAQGTHFYHWLDDLPANFLVETITELFYRHGFTNCPDGALEPGVEKVAIYFDRHKQEVSHAARQLPNGHWTSKLGRGRDIEHNTLDALEGEQGDSYGVVVKFMRRERH